MADHDSTDVKLGRVLSAAVLLLAATLAARETRRWFVDDVAPPPQATFEASWISTLDAASYRTNVSAPITLVEFIDFECPACAGTYRAIRELESRYPKQLSVALVHFPLKNHLYAKDGARALECAKGQNGAAKLMEVLFTDRRSILQVRDSAFAKNIGMTDEAAYLRCMADTSTHPMVKARREVGERLGVNSTPTIMINGWRYRGSVGAKHLSDAVSDLLDGRPPRHSTGKEALNGK